MPIIPMTNYPPLDVGDAIQYATEWRNLIGPLGNGEVLLRAFNIPSSDLINLYDFWNENKGVITGFRAYLGLHANTAKIMLVPTTSAGDILTDANNISLIYDFTAPCPSQCDTHSKLYNDQNT